MWLRALLSLTVFVFSAQMLTAQVIRGNLLDEATDRPIESGTVTLLTRDSAFIARVSTDTAGAFLLPVARPGAYRLGAERLGFVTAISPPITLSTRDTIDVEFRLSTQVMVLKPLVVTSKRRRPGPLADFQERARQRGFGTFITRDDIEKRHPYTTTALLRTIPGIQLFPRARGGGHHIRLRNCSPAIFIDGVRFEPLGFTVDDMVSVLDLEGIEVYKTAAEAPVQYTSRNPGCGVILFWTRIE